MKFNKHDARRIIEEARANVSERGFERVEDAPPEPETYVRVESRNERHRRELTEQDERDKQERRERKRAEARHKQADWSQWERWADAKIASAIANERRQVVSAMGDEVRKAIAQIYKDIAQEVKALRIELLNLQASLDQNVSDLRGLVKSDGAKVIDMPKRAASN
jgi:hypothetical protein